MTTSVSQEQVFDTFYSSTRHDVLLQAFLLTGDLTAATTATKDAYAIAWHHWPKVRRLDDPRAYVRPLAWRIAARRHTGRIWHRNRGLTDEHKAVLDATHRLSGANRRALLLVDLAGVPQGDAARELAATPTQLQARLAAARAEITGLLGPSYLESMRSLSVPASAARLPRPPIVLRAGRKRRRTHSLVAALGAIALTISVGAAAREPGLERASAVHQLLPGGRAVGERLPAGISLTTADNLLQSTALAQLTPDQPWNVSRTDNNTRGDGINTICQKTRFADPRGLASLVRVFDAVGRPERTTLQTVEISQDEAAAKRAYRTTVGWFASCQVARLQLQGSYQVKGIGDEATLMRLALSGNPSTTYSIGVARVAEVTIALVTKTTGGDPPTDEATAATLSRAVSMLCPTDRAECSGTPSISSAPPPAAGDEPGFLSTIDLPAVRAIKDKWVGVTSVQALTKNLAATMCDKTDFGKGGATKARTRTYLIPQADVPVTFGLTETYGQFAGRGKAAAFLAKVRKRIEGCQGHDLTTKVTDAHHTKVHRDGRVYDIATFRIVTPVSDTTKVTYRVGLVQVGRSVAQVTFVPAGYKDIDAATFDALVKRAGQRLGELN